MGLVDRLTPRSCVLFLGESKTEVGGPPYRLVRASSGGEVRVFMEQQLRRLRGSGKLGVSLTPGVCGGWGGGAVLEWSSPLPLWEKENYSRAIDPGNCSVLPWGTSEFTCKHSDSWGDDWKESPGFPASTG